MKDSMTNLVIEIQYIETFKLFFSSPSLGPDLDFIYLIININNWYTLYTPNAMTE